MVGVSMLLDERQMMDWELPKKPDGGFWVRYKRYHDGEPFKFPDVPDEVWRCAVVGVVELNGGVYDEDVFDARLLVALAFGEGSDWRGRKVDEGKGLGRYSIVRETWQEYGGPEMIGGRDGRHDSLWSARIAAKIVYDLGLFQARNRDDFVWLFTKPPCWSRDEDLAVFVWDVWQGLKSG
jgi:hypothetical protein